MFIDVRYGEAVQVDGAAVIQPVKKSGHIMRLRVTAARAVRINKTGTEVHGSVASVE